jgi:hypothetical protein
MSYRPPFGPTPRSTSPLTTITTTTAEEPEPALDTTAPGSEADNEVTGPGTESSGKGAIAQLKPDGRSPRVKSNIKALLSFRGRSSSGKTKVPILKEKSEEEDIPETTRAQCYKTF